MDYKLENGKIIENIVVEHDPQCIIDDLNILIAMEQEKINESTAKIIEYQDKVATIENLIK